MRLLPVISLLAAAAVAAPALADSRSFPVGGFDRVASSGPYDVRVHTGQRPGVRAEGPREALDRLRIEVVGGELRIGTRPGSWWGGWNMGSRGRTVIDVAVPMVGGVALSGPGDLAVDRVRVPQLRVSLSGPGNLTLGAVEARELELNLSGPGDIAARGRVGHARVTLSGPGDVKAPGLTADDVEVRLSGPGNITLGALRSATGRLSGPGDIRILGPARCTIAKSGPGDVHCG